MTTGWEECLVWLEKDTELTKITGVRVELFRGKWKLLLIDWF